MRHAGQAAPTRTSDGGGCAIGEGGDRVEVEGWSDAGEYGSSEAEADVRADAGDGAEDGGAQTDGAGLDEGHAGEIPGGHSEGGEKSMLSPSYVTRGTRHDKAVRHKTQHRDSGHCPTRGTVRSKARSSEGVGVLAAPARRTPPDAPHAAELLLDGEAGWFLHCADPDGV